MLKKIIYTQRFKTITFQMIINQEPSTSYQNAIISDRSEEAEPITQWHYDNMTPCDCDNEKQIWAILTLTFLTLTRAECVHSSTSYEN